MSNTQELSNRRADHARTGSETKPPQIVFVVPQSIFEKPLLETQLARISARHPGAEVSTYVPEWESMFSFSLDVLVFSAGYNRLLDAGLLSIILHLHRNRRPIEFLTNRGSFRDLSEITFRLVCPRDDRVEVLRR